MKPFRRPLTLAVACLFVALFSAVAAAKPKIGILGIEAVVGAGGKIDDADTKVAKDLTAALRDRASTSSTYQLVDENRELVDEKLMNNCASEAPACMGPIGQQMKVDVLLFGSIQATKQGGVDGYKVNLKLVNVPKRAPMQSLPNEFIPLSQTKGAALANWTRTAYKRLTGETSGGTLVVKVTNADDGTVLINGERRDSLKSGQATIALDEGRYRVSIESGGFRVWEDKEITIRDGETTSKSIELVKADGDVIAPPDGGGEIFDRGGTVSSRKSTTAPKIVAAVGFGGALVVGAIAGYAWFVGPISAYEGADLSRVTFSNDIGGDNRIGNEECGKGTFAGTNEGDVNGKFKDACTWYDRKTTLMVAGVGLAAVGVGGLVWYYFTKDKTEERPAGMTGRRVSKKKQFAVTPVMSPDGAGATLQFDW